MSKLNQREAVYQAVMNTLADNNISFDDGQTPAAQSLMTKEMRAAVIAIVVAGFQAKEVELSAEAEAKYDTEAKIKGYTNGLLSNWLRKDKRLNGNISYEVKAPGSRAGSQDDQIKALKALRSTRTDAEELAEIDACIAARQATIKPTKKVATITAEQIEKLPEELRAKLGL
jgi:hypothetical protein